MFLVKFVVLCGKLLKHSANQNKINWEKSLRFIVGFECTSSLSKSQLLMLNHSIHTKYYDKLIVF